MLSKARDATEVSHADDSSSDQPDGWQRGSTQWRASRAGYQFRVCQAAGKPKIRTRVATSSNSLISGTSIRRSAWQQSWLGGQQRSHLTIGLDAVLEAVELPAGVADLDTGLADVDGDYLTHVVVAVEGGNDG
jgi:hypothetical protein